MGSDRPSRRDKSDTSRLFVAVYPPADIASRMAALLSRVGLPPHRATPVQQIHLTVHFIGDVPKRALDSTIESVERSASGLSRFILQPINLIALPERGRTRVIAVETDRPAALLEIHQRLVARLARSARADSRRDYRPHLTIARIKPPARVDLSEGPSEEIQAMRFDVDRLQIMQSMLAPSGAHHKTLHEIVLA